MFGENFGDKKKILKIFRERGGNEVIYKDLRFLNGFRFLEV